MNKIYNNFLTTENTVIAYNTKLNELNVTGAALDGAYIGRVNATVQRMHRAPQEVTFQLQARMDYLKCVHVTLRQDGSDITARIDWAKYTSAEHDCGYDFAKDREYCAEWQKVAISASSEGYGVAELHLGDRKPRKVIIDGNNIVLHRKGRYGKSVGGKDLANLIECLWMRGYEPSVLFDANIEHVFRECDDKFGLDLLEKLKQESGGDDLLVPGGIPCDKYVLQIAEMHKCPLISFDRFRNYSTCLKHRYAPLFHDGGLFIPDLNIKWTIPVNRGIANIRASVNGKFFCADMGSENVRSIFANRDNASDWETFTILPNNDGTVSLKSKANGRYVSAEINSDCRLNARAFGVDACEKFWLKEMDGKWTLRSYANGKYVSVNPNTGIACAFAAVPNDWEFLEIFYRD